MKAPKVAIWSTKVDDDFKAVVDYYTPRKGEAGWYLALIPNRVSISHRPTPIRVKKISSKLESRPTQRQIAHAYGEFIVENTQLI
jgi:hypothetical protein